MNTLNVHAVEDDLYESIPVEEDGDDMYVWKTLHLPGISITLFPARNKISIDGGFIDEKWSA